MYGERVSEYCNLYTIENTRLFRIGLSADLDVSSKWVQHIHILTKRKIWMRKQLDLKVSSTHKEVADSAKIRSYKTVKSLKQELKINPFDTGKLKT